MAIAIDGSTPAYASGADDPWVTPSFTPPNSAYLVCVITGDWFVSTPTFTITDSQGVLTNARWATAARGGSLDNGVVEVRVCQMSSSEGGVSRTISVDTNLSDNHGGAKVYVLTGAATLEPVDVVVTATGGFADPTNVNVTTTRDDTLVLGGVVGWDGDGAITSSDTYENFNIGGTIECAVIRKASITATPTTETVNINPAAAEAAGCYAFVGITSTDAPVSFVSQGAAVAGTTSITTAAYGTGWAEGDLIVCCVASNHSTTESTEPTVSGFTKIGTLNGGGGAQGAGTGNRRLTFFTREAQAGDDTTPAVDLSGGNVMIAAFSVFRKPSGSTWDTAVSAFGAETTAGTSWSQAMTTDPGFDQGDMIVAACAVRDTSNSSAEGFTATGATFGTFTERIDLSSETGNDIALHVATATVTAGPSSAAGTRTATHSTSETGVMGVLLVRSIADTGTNAAAENAGVTTTANQPTTKVSPAGGNAAVTAAANQAAAKVAPPAGVAAVTAAALDATVTTVGGTVANAECATVSVAALQPAASITATAATAAVTAAAENPAPKVAPLAANSSVAVTAGSPAPAVAPTAGAAGVTASAGSPAPKVAVNAENAPVGAAALQPTVLTGTVASAQVATVGVAANGASLSVRTNPTTADVACGVGASGKVGAPAGSAAVAAAALAGLPRVGPAPSAALVAVSAGQTSQKVTIRATETATVLVAAGNVTMGIPDVLATSDPTTATARNSSSPAVAASSSSTTSSRAGNSSRPAVDDPNTSDPTVTD